MNDLVVNTGPSTSSLIVMFTTVAAYTGLGIVIFVAVLNDIKKRMK